MFSATRIIVFLALILLIGIWAIAIGAHHVVRAFRVPEARWLSVLIAILSIAFGILVFSWPGATALALVWLIAIQAFAFGVLQIVFAFSLRNRRSELEAATA